MPYFALCCKNTPIIEKKTTLKSLFQCLEHLVNTLFLLFHVRMYVEVEGRADVGMTEYDADGFVVTLTLNVTYGIRDGRFISVEEFLQLKVAIPDIAHQQHIVRVMRLWEEKIWIEESYLTKLQQQKQFLLTTMFV